MTSETPYFPPLLPCLQGEATVLSWKLVASALSDTLGERQKCEVLQEFLADPHVQSLFADPSKPFSPSTPSSKSDFETKTAPVNVTPTPNDLYDIKQIKEDATWLSQNVNIDELAALRIVVVEFQSRAQQQLRGPLSTQDIVNLQDAAGVVNVQASAIFPTLNFNTIMDAEALWTDFDRPQSRRLRLLDTYLGERRYFAMAADYAMSKRLRGRFPTAPATVSPSTEMQMGKQPSDKQKCQEILLKYLQHLNVTMKAAEQIFESSIKDSKLVTEELELEWIKTHLTIAVHALGVIFQVLDMPGTEFAPVAIMEKWFLFVGQFSFLDGLQAANGDIAELITPIKCLVSVTTLKILNLPEALRYLAGESAAEDDDEPYVTDSDMMQMIHEVLVDAANAGSVTASPSIAAWSILTHRMFTSHQRRLEKRDSAQNQRAMLAFEQNIELSVQPRLTRRNSDASMVSMEAMPYDQFLSTANLSQDFVVMEQIATSVMGQGEVFLVMVEIASGLGDSLTAMFPAGMGSRMRIVMLRFIGCMHPFVTYQTEPVTALTRVLSGDKQYWDLGRPDHLDTDTDILAQALQDSAFMGQYLDQSLNRYPFEFLPFIEFCRILSQCLTIPANPDDSQSVLKLLSSTPSVTFVLPKDFQGYELALEGEQTNAFALVQPLDLFVENSGGPWDRHAAGEVSFTIPAKTKGRFMSDSGRIVHMDFPHSSLALIGKRLESTLCGRHYQSVLGNLEPEEIAASISLLATILRTETLKASKENSSTPWEQGAIVLEDLSGALTRNKDIIALVCDVLDHHLQEELSEPDSMAMSILTACIQFLHSLLPIAPGRVWSYMTRCALLNTDTTAGKLSRITANLDMILERFDFLLSSMQLLSDLVESTMTSAVQRNAGAQLKGRVQNLWAGTSDKLLARVCFSIAQTAVDIFENSSTWRFSTELHRTTLMRHVVPILNNIVTYNFSVGPSDSPGNLTGCLYPAATYIVDSFLTPSAGSLRFQPLLTTFLVSFHIPETTLYPRRIEALSDRLISSLQFATTLVRVANLLEKPQTIMEAQLFKSASLLARVCAVNSTFRRQSLQLLQALVLSAATGTGEPPSLLGYLNAQASRSFLELLSNLDRPFNQTEEVNHVWKFFAAITRNRQQWMANCLLTGKMPRDSIRKRAESKDAESKTEMSPRSVLRIATKRLQSIREIPGSEALSILDFLTSALNYYPWTIFTVYKEGEVLDSLRKYMHYLPAATTAAKTDILKQIHQSRVAAYLAEFFAMVIYHLAQIGDADGMAEHLMHDLDFYLRNGVMVGGYNASLHVNFGRNFEKMFKGCGLEDFKRSMLAPRELGQEFYYELGFADKMLGYDKGWVGLAGKGKGGQGFRDEMERANLNLSLVDAQVALFHAWEFLLLELTGCLRGDADSGKIVTRIMQVARDCLDANEAAPPTGPEVFFRRVALSRANLCLLLIQRLVAKKPPFKDVAGMLRGVWASVSGIDNPFGGGADGVAYYRTLLKILYVTLRAYGWYELEEVRKDIERSVGVEQSILNIIDKVVARNFRTIVGLVHEPEHQGGGGGAATVEPADVALLTAVLQACLGMPGIEENQVQVLNILHGHDILHMAKALYSWSDRLAVSMAKRAQAQTQAQDVLSASTSFGASTLAGGPAYGNGHGNGNSVNGHATMGASTMGSSTMGSAPGESDPIYGELSLLFLRELSTLPHVAETLAADGLLSQIASASITSYIRRPNVGPLADTAAAQRCYAIWVKGILPILVNVLRAVGVSIAPEVALVLGSFSGLLARSVARIEPPGKTRITADANTAVRASTRGEHGGYLSLLSLSEIQSLGLLCGEIAALRAAQPGVVGEVGWDGRAVEENLELWIAGSRRLLRERIVALGAREVEWRGQAPGGMGGESKVLVGCENGLEERVLMAMLEARAILGMNAPAGEAEG